MQPPETLLQPYADQNGTQTTRHSAAALSITQDPGKGISAAQDHPGDWGYGKLTFIRSQCAHSHSSKVRIEVDTIKTNTTANQTRPDQTISDQIYRHSLVLSKHKQKEGKKGKKNGITNQPIFPKPTLESKVERIVPKNINREGEKKEKKSNYKKRMKGRKEE